MAMDGMGMMLKSLGVDKDKIEADLKAFQSQGVEIVRNFQMRLNVQDQKLDLIYNLLLEERNERLRTKEAQASYAIVKADREEVTHG